MSRPDEVLDIALLRNNKDEFVIRCQEIIAITIKKYIAKEMFISTEFDDIKQNINLELIRRLPLIEKNYTGEVLMRTYMNVVIKNICLRLYEQEASQSFSSIPLSDIIMLSSKNIDDGMLITNELERFNTALKLFNKKQFKIIVCLKTYFSIPISSYELEQCFPHISDEDIALFANDDERQERATSPEDFIVVTLMLNKYIRASTTEASVLHWTNIMIQKLISLMNGKPQTRAHTKDSLKILLEHYAEHTNDNL